MSQLAGRRSIVFATVATVALSSIPAAGAASGATHVVDARHPDADDANPGSSDLPLRTIGAAARRVQPGDTVTIRTGVYREAVTVEADGTAPAPIRFVAPPTERVVITGADVIDGWETVDGVEGVVLAAPWPHRFLAWTERGAHPDDEFHRLVGRCEQVMAEGDPLRQVLRREQLARGTFFVDLEAGRLIVRDRSDRDLSRGQVAVEASVRPWIWRSRGAHVHLRGLRFRYAAGAAQHGAVEISGDGGVIDDCVVERTNSIGVTFRGRGALARRCEFAENGQMGFSAVRAHDLRLVECVCRDNSTKGWNRGWEAGGNKIVLSRGVVIERCRFLRNGGDGIWFDIGNEDATVRSCLIADNDGAGIFYEISYGLVATDNVILCNGHERSRGDWGANGGISLSSSQGCTVERNLIVANREGFQLREQERRTPRIDRGEKDGEGGEELVWNRSHRIRHNLLAYNRDAQVGGWFDVSDGRHWPRAMRSEAPGADAAPGDLSLEALELEIDRNLYARRPGQGLWQWGCRWRRHERYQDLDAVRSALALEAGGALVEPRFAGETSLDFRLPAGCEVLRRGAYPRGDPPGVRLGSVASVDVGDRFLLSTVGCGRATGYSETNKIVTVGERSHVAWLDSEEGTFRVRVRTLDRRQGTWSPTYTLGDAYDNHGGPALTVDSEGHLHIVYHPHHHAMRYRRSTRPDDASEWEEEARFGARATYPTLVCGPRDTLYLTCRESSSAHPWSLVLYRKAPGEDWTGPVTIIRSETPDYSHFQEALAWGPDQRRLHLSCRIYGGNPRRGHTVGYLRSDDGGDTWRRADGEEVELPATASTVSAIAQEREGSGVGLRCGTLAVDPDGRPHVLYSSYDELPLRTWLASLDASGAWRRRSLAGAVPPEWAGWGLTVPGGLTFDAEGRLRAALTLIRPEGTGDTTIWGHPTSEVILLSAERYDGPIQSRVLEPVDPSRPRWLPNLERPTGAWPVASPGLIFTDGGRGENNREIVANRVWWVAPRW